MIKRLNLLTMLFKFFLRKIQVPVDLIERAQLHRPNALPLSAKCFVQPSFYMDISDGELF